MQRILTDVSSSYRTVTVLGGAPSGRPSADLHQALLAAISEAELDNRCRVLILTGPGISDICHDQEGSAANTPSPFTSTWQDRALLRLVQRVRSLSMPIIRAVDSDLIGRNVNVALSCDIVVVSRPVRFMRTTKIDANTQHRTDAWGLPSIIGRAGANGIPTFCSLFSSSQAVQWGLVWKCVDDAQLMETARNMAETLATQPPHTHALIRQAFDASCSV